MFLHKLLFPGPLLVVEVNEKSVFSLCSGARGPLSFIHTSSFPHCLYLSLLASVCLVRFKFSTLSFVIIRSKSFNSPLPILIISDSVDIFFQISLSLTHSANVYFACFYLSFKKGNLWSYVINILNVILCGHVWENLDSYNIQ